MTDNENFNNKASDLHAEICKDFKDLGETQDLMKDIEEGLNKVRLTSPSHKNKAVGQGNVTYCTYISLMFIHLI